MKLKSLLVVALFVTSPAGAATLADLDQHLDRQRGHSREAAPAPIGNDAAFCRSRGGNDTSRQEAWRQALSTPPSMPRGRPGNARPTACTGGSDGAACASVEVAK